jgi:hypothetical protein
MRGRDGSLALLLLALFFGAAGAGLNSAVILNDDGSETPLTWEEKWGKHENPYEVAAAKRDLQAGGCVPYAIARSIWTGAQPLMQFTCGCVRACVRACLLVGRVAAAAWSSRATRSYRVAFHHESS